MEQQKKKNFRNKNIFEYISNILCQKNVELYRKHVSEDGFDADFKKVVVLRYLSMSPDERVRGIIFENQLALDRMDCKLAYRYLMKIVPKQSSGFIRYIK